VITLVAKAGNGWKLAPSLVALFDETDARWPKRSKAIDGSIGDRAHAARKSDHNPGARNLVHAGDFTSSGIDVQEFLDTVIGHPSVWYVIHKGHIWSRTYGWKKRVYTGSNPHNSHIHVSILSTTAAEKKTAWFKDKPKPAPKPVEPKPVPEKPGGNGPGYVPGRRVLSLGDKGSDVALLQRFLGIKDDGIFGMRTRKHVIRYQDLRGLARDGVVGPKTWKPILKALGLDS
jgi:hypothetical protein